MPKTAAVTAPKPTTVAERRRALRGPSSAPKSATRKIEIDLTKPGARKQLTALFPRPENDTMLSATADLEAAALEYIEARDAATLANERKEAAGNVLCNAITKNLGVAGVGWKAEWGMSKGNVEWSEVAKEQNIPEEVIAKHRKPETRTLNVRELADDA